ncbi:MAG: hypothetical protein NZ550_00490 [Fimbriimonadales bacterium]|nr:hypothetical protein [Fimbriimonadales bacterium]
MQKWKLFWASGIASIALMAVVSAQNLNLLTYCSSFVGLNTQGTWNLIIGDLAPFEAGYLEEWCVTFIVPEPASMVALGVELAGLIGLRHRFYVFASHNTYGVHRGRVLPN